MELLSRQTGEDEFFARTPEFEPLKGLRNPESDWDIVGQPELEWEAMGSVVWVQCTNLRRVCVKSIDSRASG